MEHKELQRRILSIMRRKSVMRNVNYSISDMMAETGVGKTLLSKVINDEMHTTFLQLLNGIRLEEARRLLVSDKHSDFLIEDIAFYCGFKSRVTFHRYFKMTYGMTAAEMRKGQRN